MQAFMDGFGFNEEQRRMIMEFAAQLGLPETRPENSALENSLIDLCVEGSDGTPTDDAAKAEQLQKVLKAAAARGDKFNVNVRSTSGLTPLTMTAFSNGVQRMRVLLKHGADANAVTINDETGLHIAAMYGHYDVLKELLEAGANPLLLDCGGRTALDLARRPQTHPGLLGDAVGDGLRGKVDKSRLVALLEQHTAKYEKHLRTRAAGAKGGASSSSSSNSTAGRTATTAPHGTSSSSSSKPSATAGSSAATEYSATSCDACGKVPGDGAKLMKCSRCKLRAYCSKECQAKDWPTHKAPCKMVADIKQRAAEVMDVSQPPGTRMQRANAFAHQPALQQIAVDAKIIPQLLAALETDKPIYQGDLPTLVAVLGLIRDQENHIPGGFHPVKNIKPLNSVAVQVFVNAGGPVAVLKAVSRRDVRLCHDQTMAVFRTFTDLCATPQACKSMIKKGVAAEVVQLLAPHVKHGHHLVVTNIGFCLAKLLQVEQKHLIQERQQQQQSTGSKEKKKKKKQDQQQQQGQEQQLPPVLATVLERVELQKFINALGPNLTYNPGNFYQSRMEIWPALLASKLGYTTFKTQQPELFKQLLDNVVNAMGLAAEEALAINLHTLYMVYCHGGLDVLQDEFGPVLLQYKQYFPGQEEQDRSGEAPVQSFRAIDDLKPGESMTCQGLFISCLFDAAEHTTETYQCSSVNVNMWRESVLLLRALWDAVPAIRPVYIRFIGGMEELYADAKRRRSPQEQKMWHGMLMRSAIWESCRQKGVPYLPQSQFLSLLKQGEDEIIVALCALAKRVS